MLEKPSLEAALITFLLKPTFFFDFLLFLRNPEAAKGSSRQKQAFQENLHRNKPNERKINKNEKNKLLALNFSFVPKHEKNCVKEKRAQPQKAVQLLWEPKRRTEQISNKVLAVPLYVPLQTEKEMLRNK